VTGTDIQHIPAKSKSIPIESAQKDPGIIGRDAEIAMCPCQIIIQYFPIKH
jgi:hypothetical protein